MSFDIEKLSSVPGSPKPTRPTSQCDAWAHGYYRTVELTADVEAVRVYRRRPGAVDGGAWFALGDAILTRSDYKSLYALPSGFSAQASIVLMAGTLLNIGYCSSTLCDFPQLRAVGGGIQAELLDGPSPNRRELAGFWMDRSGSA